MKDFYQILDIAKTASQDEIKSAFRKMAHKWHPDTNMGNEEAENKFKEVYEAYDVLKDVAKRKTYNKSLVEDAKRIDNENKNGETSIEYKFFRVLVVVFSISLMLIISFLIAARNKDHPAMESVVKLFEKIDKEKLRAAFDKFGEIHLTAENIFKETSEVDNPFKQLDDEEKAQKIRSLSVEEEDGESFVQKGKDIYTKGISSSGKDLVVAK